MTKLASRTTLPSPVGILSDSDVRTSSALTTVLGIIYFELHSKTSDTAVTVLVLGSRDPWQWRAVGHPEVVELLGRASPGRLALGGPLLFIQLVACGVGR